MYRFKFSLAIAALIVGTASASEHPAFGQQAAPIAAKGGASSGQMTRPVRNPTKRIGIVIFDRYETLDVFGPVQMWGRLPDYQIVMISQTGAPVTSSQGVSTNVAYSFANAPQMEIIMVPGGGGTRSEVNNPAMLDFLRRQDRWTEWTTSVCTGAAVLAKAGVLDARRATTNKRAYPWATSQSAKVQWQGRARWVVDGKYVTSSGVSAGTDMALALVEKLYDRKMAERIADGAEYTWNHDPQNDPFAIAGQ
ncbi:DJ-1/PfpI family protein [Novosphingobium gossypii]|uniref:DJ-1/PfpI family protein n=1 Tax=Novosphingobium gossypii TaxID=1604774 RepID=UPI003D1CF834